MQRLTFVFAALIAASPAALAPPVAAQPYEGRAFHRRHDWDDRRWRYDDRPATRHFCWYESGWHGRGSYWCGYAWRVGRGWSGADEGDYEYQGAHYRGYWEDGTGRRFYDRGGFGVGHFDYGR